MSTDQLEKTTKELITYASDAKTNLSQMLSHFYGLMFLWIILFSCMA